MKIKLNKRSFLLALLLGFTFDASAAGPPPPPGDPPPVLPIDGQLSMVVGMAVIFGMYMIFKNIKSKTL